MTNQEEYNILMSVKNHIKRKDMKKFISVTKVQHKGLLDIIFSFLKLRSKVLDYTISYKISKNIHMESIVMSCGIICGNISELVTFFTTICKILDDSQYYNVELINLDDE